VQTKTCAAFRRGWTTLFAFALALVPMDGMAELPCYDENGVVTVCEGPGGIRYNGSRTQPAYIRAQDQAAAGLPQNWLPNTAPGFLFEPESPYASLKSVPTWNELEQLLDNPYAVTPDLVTPGNFDGWKSYASTIVRRPNITAGSSLLSPGPALPPFQVHPLNYNPTDGEEMRLLNNGYAGGLFMVPHENFQPLPRLLPNLWSWTFRPIVVSPGAGRVFGPEIDYNGPPKADPFTCVINLELVPPEGSNLCGLDPGEPGYAGFGVLRGALLRSTQYSTPAVPLTGGGSPATILPAGARLFDPTRGTEGCSALLGCVPGRIDARNPTSGAGGLRKPSLRVPTAGGNPSNPNYLLNTDPNNTTPSSENDYYRQAGSIVATLTAGPIPTGRNTAIALGKALFWDMQVGSDGVQSCGTCHFNGVGADTRTKNQINPNHLGGDLNIDLHGINAANQELTAADFPFHKLWNPDVAGDPACTTPITANVENVTKLVCNNISCLPGGTAPLDHPVLGDVTVCSAANIRSDLNDVASSMGVIFNKFSDIAPIGVFQPANNNVAAVMPDLRNTAGDNATDPIPVFQGFRRVEPRNTPTMQAAGFNFDNFWDGRARHDFNGGSVFGAADPQTHVWVNNGTASGVMTATRQLIKFASIASLATGPGLSEFEMSFLGRNWQKVGKKLLQAGVTPLANQLVDPTDSVLGPFSGQRTTYNGPVNRPGRPGLNVSYQELIQAAYFAKLWANTNQHFNGCYTDGNAALHPNQCVGTGVVPILNADGTVSATNTADPFDGFVLTLASGVALPNDTNQFRQIEANFPLFWGMSLHAWVQILVPDNTPFDQFLDANPDAFMSLGDTSEALLVDDLLNCTSATQRNCFREVGNFKRDPNVIAYDHATGEGGAGSIGHAAGGTRQPGAPDPLLGADIFFASNLSLKNPAFRSGRCGACHNMPTLTDNTVAFTFKAILPDFPSEFSPTAPGVELLLEPLGRGRIISGFLLESEIAENGQDGIERRFINQSIVPNPVNGIAYPDGVFNPPDYYGAGQAFIDNGVYNLGVRPIANDSGRGGTDAFGWPLSIATLLLKNLGGADFEPGNAMATFDPSLGPEGGLFEESAQDQQINPGGTDEPVNPLLPPYLAPFINGVPVGDSQPDLDEPFAGINTLTDVAMLEGFLDNIGPINPAAVKNEALNMGEQELMGTWPEPNRVLRDGAFKAPQLRDVEKTGPYFHNGGMLTLRQVVDFYVRGGDFPMTNAKHRDFLLVNLDIEAQSNLNETEKIALVDFLLELTDERAAHAAAPFDHPEVIIPVDGRAPDNTLNRGNLLAQTAGDCGGVVGAGPCFRDIPAVGSAGVPLREPNFLNVRGTLNPDGTRDLSVRNSPNCNPAVGPISHYCH